MKRKIYLDYAATTPVDSEVIEAMEFYWNKKFGNSSSLHSFGREAKEALEESRKVIAKALGAKSGKIIFTGSATESNNLALKGLAFANKEKGKHILISPIEHECVLESAKWLARQGFEIEKLPVDKDGLVEPAEVQKRIKKETILVSVMHANNEIGTIEPIEEIGKICRDRRIYFERSEKQGSRAAARGPYFHTDAAQTFGKIPIDVEKLNVDLLTASSHKIYGPKGAALLFVRDGIKIEPLLHGGGHEFGLRSSTVNVPAIVGLTKAVEIAHDKMAKESQRLLGLRDKLIKGILEKIPKASLTGHPKKRLPNHASFIFLGVEGESIIFELDLKGIAASTGSACASAKLEPSHVLVSIGLKPYQAHGSLRLSLGRWTTEKEIGYVLKVLPKIIEKLRKISPFKF